MATKGRAARALRGKFTAALHPRGRGGLFAPTAGSGKSSAGPRPGRKLRTAGPSDNPSGAAAKLARAKAGPAAPKKPAGKAAPNAAPTPGKAPGPSVWAAMQAEHARRAATPARPQPGKAAAKVTAAKRGVPDGPGQAAAKLKAMKSRQDREAYLSKATKADLQAILGSLGGSYTSRSSKADLSERLHALTADPSVRGAGAFSTDATIRGATLGTPARPASARAAAKPATATATPDKTSAITRSEAARKMYGTRQPGESDQAWAKRVKARVADIRKYDQGVDVSPAPRKSGPATQASAHQVAENRIREAFEKLQHNTPGNGWEADMRPDGWVSITDLRRELSNMPRADVDEALVRLARQDPNVSVVPETKQLSLTPADREAALRMGNQDKHWLLINPPVDEGALSRVRTSGVRNASDADLATVQRDPKTPSSLYDEMRAEVKRRAAESSAPSAAPARQPARKTAAAALKAAKTPRARLTDAPDRAGAKLSSMTSPAEGHAYLASASVAELKAIAKSTGTPTTGISRKADIAKRIVEHTIGAQ